MAGTGSLYDHEILLGSTTYRFKLARGENGQPLYQVIPEVLPHQSQLKFAQQDWSGGHGQFEVSDSRMYFEGQSIDTTQPGRFFLGPEITTSAAGTYVAAVLNFLQGAVAYDVDGGGSQWVTETTASRNDTTNDMTLLPATPAENDAYYFGSLSKFDRIELRLSTKGVGTWTITWEYYNGSTWAALADVSDGSTGFTATTGYKTISFTLPADWATTTVNSIASTYWVRARVSAYTSVTTQPKGRQCWCASLTAGSLTNMGESPVQFIRFPAASAVFCATATKIYEHDYLSLGEWTQKMVFASGSVTQLAVFGATMLIALGQSDEYWYTADGDIFTESTSANPETQCWLVAPSGTGTSNVVWKVDSTTLNVIVYTADPTGAATYTSGGTIGDLAGTIINLFLHNDNLMIGKDDGLYYLDSDAAVHYLMPELRQNTETRNFKYVTHRGGSTFFSFLSRIKELTSGNSVADIGPLQNIGDVGKLGDCVGLSADAEWLYVAMDEGTNTHIYKGKELENGKWSWCPWVFLGTNSCATIESIEWTGQQRTVYFGYGNNAGYVICSDNMTAALTPSHCTSGWLRMSYTYAANPYFDKLWQSVTMQTKGCASGRTVQVSYRKDTDTAASTCTSALTSNGTNKTNLSSALASNRIQFQVNLASDTPTVTPEVSYFEARGVEKPEVVRVHECVYEVDSDPRNKAGTIYGWLRTIAASTSLAKFARLALDESTASGTSYVWVTMQAGYPQEVFLENTRTTQPRMGVKCRWQEVSFTVS